MENPDQHDTFFGYTELIGNHVLGHSAIIRTYPHKSKNVRLTANLANSPNLPDGKMFIVYYHGG